MTRGQQHLFADQLGRQEAFGLVWRWRKTQGRLVEAVNLSAIADTDTGYGNELNVVRTVRGYAALGGPHQG